MTDALSSKHFSFSALVAIGACGGVDPTNETPDVDAGAEADAGDDADGGGPDAGPVCSTRIAATRFGQGQDVFTVNADGSSLTNVTDPGTGMFPGWSPDGAKLVFTSMGDIINIANADGSGLQELTTGRLADWSPDGTKIAFTRRANAQTDIYVINVDGTGETQLTNLEGLRPKWTPDGTKIVFEADRDGDRDVFVMNADGTGQVNLSNNAVVDSRPFVSPDSSVVIFASNGALGSVNIDGTGLVTRALGGIVTAPQFSPDGSQIVASLEQDGATNVVVSAPDGSDSLILGQGTLASWSPDGVNIAYLQSAPGEDGVAVAIANVAASGATIADGPFLDVSWSPCQR